MGDKFLRALGYGFIVLVVAVGIMLAGRSILGTKGDSDRAPPPLGEKTTEMEEGGRQIQGLDKQVSKLKEELEKSSKKLTELQAKLDETSRALSSAQQKSKSTKREVEQAATTQSQPAERVAPKPAEPTPPPSWRRPAEPGSYEVIRATPVFEEPSGSSRKVSTIQKGTKVTIVGSVGEWLEVRSKHGNPPGFIRRDDAMFIQRSE